MCVDPFPPFPSSAERLTKSDAGVTLNGAVEQYTLHGLVVQEGESNSCLATNSGAWLISFVRRRFQSS